jgi:hypothetical protein
MRLSRLVRKTRWRLRHFTVTHRVVSFGGVGSTSLIAHLENGDRARVWYHSRDKHCLHPELLPEARRGLPVKACFIFGDPYRAVLSVFRRGLHPRHERSMTRSMPHYRRAIRKDTTLLEYLQGGTDRFFLGEHLENWIGYRGDRVEVLAVKYEALGEHVGTLLEFLECDRPFQVRSRSSRYEEEPPEIRAGLEVMYGRLKEKIDGLPSLIRVNA